MFSLQRFERDAATVKTTQDLVCWIRWNTIVMMTDLAGDGDGLPQPVGPQLQSDLLPVVVEDPRLLRGHNHVQEDVGDPGRGHCEVHPALVEALVPGADVVQHQAPRVVVPSEEGAAL